MKKKYYVPNVETYSKEELAHLIEAGACSVSFTCHCHYGNANTGSDD